MERSGNLRLKEGFINEEDLPAEKDPEKERTRLYEENVYQKRQKGSG